MKATTIYDPGTRVWKNPKTTSKFNPKPFKSGLKVNTVKGYTVNPNTQNMAYTFVEDDSVVDCMKCSPAPDAMPGEGA